MNLYSWIQIIIYLVVLLALAKPLGSFMAQVYEGKRTFLDPILGPVERLIYRVSGVNAGEEMGWKTYAIAVMVFNILGLLVVYALQRLQAVLPLNPAVLGGGYSRFKLEHGGQLCHEHELARLRRGSNDELPVPDARAGGTEFRIRGDRYGGADRHDPRDRTPFC